MVNEANDISVPVVNVQWLNDKILGTRSGIIDFYDSKYQIFDSPNPFSVNFDMVPELIGTVLHCIYVAFYVFLFSPENII